MQELEKERAAKAEAERKLKGKHCGILIVCFCLRFVC